jgi:hypothetical protein
MEKVKIALYMLALASAASVICFYIGKGTVNKSAAKNTVIHTTDTVFSFFHINKTGKGSVLKDTGASPGKHAGPVICKTDTDSISGFRADIKYAPGTGMWDNNYTIPARTIYREEIRQIEASAGNGKSHWVFGIGAAAGYTAGNFAVRPSVSIGMTFPYKSVEISLDLKLEPAAGNSFQLNPYLNGQFKVRF